MDVIDLRDFYSQHLGIVARRLINRGIRARWEAGYADTLRVLTQQPWTHPFDPIEGFILHETEAGAILSEG